MNLRQHIGRFDDHISYHEAGHAVVGEEAVHGFGKFRLFVTIRRTGALNACPQAASSWICPHCLPVHWPNCRL